MGLYENNLLRLQKANKVRFAKMIFSISSLVWKDSHSENKSNLQNVVLFWKLQSLGSHLLTVPVLRVAFSCLCNGLTKEVQILPSWRSPRGTARPALNDMQLLKGERRWWTCKVCYYNYLFTAKMPWISWININCIIYIYIFNNCDCFIHENIHNKRGDFFQLQNYTNAKNK